MERACALELTLSECRTIVPDVEDRLGSKHKLTIRGTHLGFSRSGSRHCATWSSEDATPHRRVSERAPGLSGRSVLAGTPPVTYPASRLRPRRPAAISGDVAGACGRRGVAVRVDRPLLSSLLSLRPHRHVRSQLSGRYEWPFQVSVISVPFRSYCRRVRLPDHLTCLR
ncbi:hypothetical protein SCP_0508130 [Sparassis crispa]|uniref:Uncharacterized protein n=1 Tax=Sparassis crispa TaxID=139825 RepID=A0A401GNF0_9APHY|nr:hypothetical protein SCP_0508130 [Sparassis crispa]GBE83757.1 hypothetical protein SCP_0508130 [Sparassis crispa]